jgi:putative hemolysin
MFPAGEVASLDISKRRVLDRPWNPHAARIARRAGACCLPMFVEGKNSLLFQLAGLLHPRLRTLLLLREMFGKQGRTCRVRLGSLISPDRLRRFKTDIEQIQYLRYRTDALGIGLRSRRQCGSTGQSHARRVRCPETIRAPVAADKIAAEVASLPAQQLLLKIGNLCVFQALAVQMPHMLVELGRQREIAFRSVGEGTSRDVDLDSFDQTYTHLFLWNCDTRELVGAYRLALLDESVQRSIPEILYSSTLFVLTPSFVTQIGPALELGRSFVRAEYQNRFTPLMLLWKGIGRIVAGHRLPLNLFGPVSISSRYTRASRLVIKSFLERPCLLSPLSGTVLPRHPFQARHAGELELTELGASLEDFDELSDVLTDIEGHDTSVPPLLKSYIKLGARTVAFSVDSRFSDCLDCLCVFKLADANERTIKRYVS